MTVFNGTQMAKLNAASAVTPDPGFVDGTVRSFVEEVTLATQTTSDTINIARLPKGAVVLYGVMTASATLGGTATVAIGIAGATGKYRAAATFTTANTPTFFGVAAGLSVANASEEEVFITIAAASLPGSGSLKVTIFYTFD